MSTGRLMGFGLRLATVSVLGAGLAFWHHIRVRNFLIAAQDELRKRLPTRLRRLPQELSPSILDIDSGVDGARYRLRVRHKARCLELGLQIEGDVDAVKRWAETLSRMAEAIQAQLGPNVQLEAVTRRSIRLEESLPLRGDPKAPVSESLTDEVAAEAAERLAQYIEVLQPTMRST